MNKKNFKIEYDNYMKNVKPTPELIEKTIQRAYQEKSNLEKSKKNKFIVLFSNINFKRYSAIACTLIFALFAVKLWNSIPKQPIPIDPTTTTTVETTSTENENEIVDVPTETQITTTSIIESEFTTNDINIDNTQSEETTLNDNISNNDVTTYTHQSSTTNTSVNNNTSNNTQSSSSTTQLDSSTQSSSSTTITVITSNNDSISTTTTIPTVNTTNTTLTTTTQMNQATTITTNNIDSSVDVTTTHENTYTENATTAPTDGALETTGLITEPSSTFTENTMEENTQGTTVTQFTTTIATTTTQPIEDTSKLFGAFRITLYNNPNGFFYNGTIYTDKIKQYFSFDNNIICVLKLSNTLTSNQCEAIIILDDYDNLSNDYSSILSEFNCSYSSIDTTNKNHFQNFNAPTGLDFNGDGVGASNDILDVQSIYDVLYIDD